jgi:SAM-dependent methyltransferase
MNNYKIAEGYQINTNVGHHVDNNYTDEGQDEVYEYARKIADKNGYKKIIDIGCGSGFKLMKYFSDYKTIGYEVEPALSFLTEKYSDRVWRNSGESEVSFNYEFQTKCDLIICSDVIEHIINPDELLTFIKNFDSKAIIISTPCREVLCKSERYKHVYGQRFNGPPLNQCHVREWTSNEFINYLSSEFDIQESFHGINQIECQFHLIKNK